MASTTPQIWAGLIGISDYHPGDLNQGERVSYPSLKGCVFDVESLKTYFTDTLKVDEDHILTLTSPAPPGCNDLQSKLPTHDNIIRLIRDLEKKAQPGDIVYIHYSGHGGRAATIYPQVKGDKRLDEVLVPYDRNLGGKYVRDLELGRYLKSMVDKKLVVTIMLDCCYSGGATRDEGWTHRGIGVPDLIVLDSDKRDVHIEELRAELGLSRGFTFPSDYSWIMEPHGYELFAACRLHESARELEDSNVPGRYHGALTWHFLELLRDGGRDLTHGMLHLQLRNRIHELFLQRQTPEFAGKHSRILFSTNTRREEPSVVVKAIEGRKVILGAGSAQAVSEGSSYALFPWNAVDLDKTTRKATVKISAVSEFESEAEFVEGNIIRKKQAKVGYKAIAVYHNIPKLSISITSQDPKHEQNLSELQNAVKTDGPVQMIFNDSQARTRYRVGIRSPTNEFELQDHEGTPVPGFPLSSDSTVLLKRLSHLAKYEMRRNLKAPQTSRGLAENFSFEIFDHPLSLIRDNVAIVEDGGEVSLKFVNRGDRPVSITILNFQPRWGVARIYPPDSDYETIESGAECPITLAMDIPKEIDGAINSVDDTLKVFVATTPESFRPLELADIDEEANRGTSVEDLADTFNSLGVTLRDTNQESTVWATREVVIRTKRKGS